jgi:serine-type D-Ala-D-Ala carboxypeptidase/endopeptidase
MPLRHELAAAALLAAAGPAVAQDAPAATIDSLRGDVHAIFEGDRVAAHAPGAVYGIVKDGKLVLVEGLGARESAVGRRQFASSGT